MFQAGVQNNLFHNVFVLGKDNSTDSYYVILGLRPDVEFRDLERI